MPNITFIESNGTEHLVSIPVGWSLMKGAIHHGIPGILAECGGACVCATCHVYVTQDWHSILAPMGPLERDTIEFALDASNDSRLSCQLTVVPKFDGLVIHLPAAQTS